MKQKPRTPKSTNVDNFYDSAYSSRDPGEWPLLLQRAWEERQQSTEPLPHAVDNPQSTGSRAGQYSS